MILDCYGNPVDVEPIRERVVDEWEEFYAELALREIELFSRLQNVRLELPK